MPSPRLRPRASALGYWLAAAVMLAGLIGGGVLAAVTGFGAYERLTDMPRAAVPGDVTFSVTDTGDQLVYYIGEADTSWRELGLTVTGPDGQAVPVKSYTLGTKVASIAAHDHYDEYAAHPRFAVATFRADQTGGYEIATTSAAEDGAKIAVGENLVRPVLFGLVGALAVVLAGVTIGVVLIIVTVVRRAAPPAA
ncbi:MAG: hypothetical protein ACM3MJ_05410 [Deltaproteobacteria bacterium]